MINVADNKITMSYSSMNTFDGCARKYQYQKLLGIADVRASNQFAADVGNAMHRAFQDYLIHKDREQAFWVLMKSFPKYEYNYVNHKRGLLPCFTTLDAMINQAPEMELVKIQLGDEIRCAIEVPFEIEITNSALSELGYKFFITGAIDALMYDNYKETFKTLDIKTHQNFQTNREAEYEYNSQQTPYSFVLQHIAGKEISSFDVVYLDTFIDILNPRVTEYEYTRYPYDIYEWLQKTANRTHQIARYIKQGNFPRKETGCTFFNKTCKFFEHCRNDDIEDIKQMLLLETLGLEPREKEEPWISLQLELPEKYL